MLSDNYPPVRICRKCGNIMVKTEWFGQAAFQCVKCYHIEEAYEPAFTIREDSHTGEVSDEWRKL